MKINMNKIINMILITAGFICSSQAIAAPAKKPKPFIESIKIQCLNDKGGFVAWNEDLDAYQCSPEHAVIVAKIGGSGVVDRVTMSAWSEQDRVGESKDTSWAPGYATFKIDLCRVGFNTAVNIKVVTGVSSKQITVNPYCGD